MLASHIRELVEALEGQVENGGFMQFFSNSFGANTAETLSALDEIGAFESAALLRRACRRFPNGVPPVSDDQRRQALDEIGESDPFSAEDRDFYRRRESLESLIQAAERAEDELILGGEASDSHVTFTNAE